MIVKLKHTSYPLHIGEGLLNTIGDKIKKTFPSSKIVVISDDKVFSLYGDKVVNNIKDNGIIVNAIVLPQGEGTKSFSKMEHVINKLIEFGTSRTDVLVALGGGVIGDLTGFVAATYLRGVKYIQIPTTLLAQVDSSIGGKTAINLPQGKNLVGAFYHPAMVIIDPEVLKTLNDINFAGGMAEIIKTAFIMDKDLYEVLVKYSGRESIQPALSDVITKCCKNKLIVVQEDEKDTGLRLTLNFGHTLGHAMEKSKEIKIAHGQAVAIGMAEMAKASIKQNLAEESLYNKIVNLLKTYDLPYEMPKVPLSKLFEIAQRDKKVFNAKLKLVIVKDVGDCFIHPINISDVERFYT